MENGCNHRWIAFWFATAVIVCPQAAQSLPSGKMSIDDIQSVGLTRHPRCFPTGLLVLGLLCLTGVQPQPEQDGFRNPYRSRGASLKNDEGGLGRGHVEEALPENSNHQEEFLRQEDQMAIPVSHQRRLRLFGVPLAYPKDLSVEAGSTTITRTVPEPRPDESPRGFSAPAPSNNRMGFPSEPMPVFGPPTSDDFSAKTPADDDKLFHARIGIRDGDLLEWPTRPDTRGGTRQSPSASATPPRLFSTSGRTIFGAEPKKADAKAPSDHVEQSMAQDRSPLDTGGPWKGPKDILASGLNQSPRALLSGSGGELSEPSFSLGRNRGYLSRARVSAPLNRVHGVERGPTDRALPDSSPSASYPAIRYQPSESGESSTQFELSSVHKSRVRSTQPPSTEQSTTLAPAESDQAVGSIVGHGTQVRGQRMVMTSLAPPALGAWGTFGPSSPEVASTSPTFPTLSNHRFEIPLPPAIPATVDENFRRPSSSTTPLFKPR